MRGDRGGSAGIRVALIKMRPPGARANGSGAGPPLGLLGLASFVRRERPGLYDFALHDMYFWRRSETRAWLLGLQPQVIAISAMTADVEALEALSAMCAADLPDVPLVLGGPHAAAFPNDCLCLPGVVAIVTGEGELPFLDVLDAVAGTRGWPDVRGVTVRMPDGTVRSTPPPPAPSLGDLPAPAFDLVDLDAYAAAPNMMATLIPPPYRYLPIFTTRGCPYECVYCHKLFGRKMRELPVERVVDEIERLLADHRVRDFQVYDDIFNARPGRMESFCREVQKRRLDVRFFFVNGLRFDKLDRVQLEAMRESGVVYTAAALESASPRMQERLHKHLDVERLLENVAIADSLGMFVTGLMLVGIPGETAQDLEMTIRAAESSRFHFAVFSILNPYRGTPIGEELAANGTVITPHDLLGLYGHGRNYAGFPEEELKATLRDAYRRFWTLRRALTFVARHPALEAYGSLLVPRTSQLLLRRVLFALGLREEQAPDEPWTRARPLPEPFLTATRLAASAARSLAQSLVAQSQSG
jgi:radical SAM superfamily enzyme YgiQ (UPF0313 family)